MMKRRHVLAATSSAIVVGSAGCLGSIFGDDEPDIPEEDIAATIVIDNDHFRSDYEPVKEEIETGEAVRWQNDSDRRYELASNDTYGQTANWDIDVNLEPGESTAYLFEEPGYYAFHERVQTQLQVCGGIAVGEPLEDMPRLNCE